jgi:hypothetical protein
MFCDDLTTDGIIVNRSSWAVKNNDTLSDQIELIEGLQFETVPTVLLPFARCGTVEFKGLRKDLIDDDGENFYYVQRKGSFVCSVPLGTSDRAWTFPNLPFDGLDGDYYVTLDNIVAHELTGDTSVINGVSIDKTYKGSVTLINDDFITCGFSNIQLVSNKIWIIEYDIGVGKSGNL